MKLEIKNTELKLWISNDVGLLYTYTVNTL